MRRFSEEEQEIIRRLVESDGYSRNIVNLIDGRGLEGVRFSMDRTTLSAELLFEAIGQTPSDDEVRLMGSRQESIAKMILSYVALFRYLEKHDLVITYKPANSSGNIIEFGLGAVNLPAHRWKLNDKSLAGLVAEYYDKEIIPTRPLKHLVENDFIPDEEKRFKSQMRATWTAIGTSIIIGILSLAVGGTLIYLNVAGKT
ncbi:hypothetical protein [Chromohalobacter canadensis]|uniref:Uncharacterized protein n=1 Tax=Chromohalobacter canadensis TaxID=141389 RepID=A0ABZ0YBY8_9GAMM|nr:hypothetical protein [Chromohalobacter canadensis]MCK0770125.1 hypothetical protein [Chromohalobacter canadensis]WQH09583.1 hypothetical protein SR908_02670 [Chromohalobacter canadensis]